MDKKENDLSKKAEDFLRIFRKGEEFTQELLKENERLRYKIIKLEEERNGLVELSDNPQVEKLRERLAEVEEERSRLIDRFKEVEEENKGFATRYVGSKKRTTTSPTCMSPATSSIPRSISMR